MSWQIGQRIKREQDELERERKGQRQEALDQFARLESTIREMQLVFQQRHAVPTRCD